MGVSRTLTVTCDYSNCRVDKGRPQVLQWSDTEVQAGRAIAPEEAKYLVLINVNEEQKAFCCQLHAAEYFLLPGYEAKQKDIIELPKPGPKPDKWAVEPREKSWMDDPQRSEHSPVNGPDGYGGPQRDA